MRLIMFAILTISCNNEAIVPRDLNALPEDSWLDFIQLANKYGQKTEEFDVQSEGGYILKLFHIIGDSTKPILFIHGAVDSSDSFIMRGNSSLMIALARDNYDIWAINLRGNRYSRKHATLNPDSDKEYWNFSAHEFGYYDVPAAIDFVLNRTQQIKLNVIGFSQGTMSMYILGATRPEYNDKINVFIALAPIGYIHNMGSYMSLLVSLAPTVNQVLLDTNEEEVLGFNSTMKSLINHFCSKQFIGYELCLIHGLFLLAGADASEIEPEYLPVIIGHFPAGTSRKNMLHLSQISTKKVFQNFDYGREQNLIKYNRTTPPEYDLSKVTMKVALIVAKNDQISTIKDVELLRKRLPNVVDYTVIKRDMFNHVDYIWGLNGNKLFFHKVFNILKRYS